MASKKIIEKLKGMGFNLMPLKPFSKFPLEESWKKLQSEMYTGIYPEDCNTAVICGKISGNLIVVDLDDVSLFDEFKEYHDKTFTVRTGSRGYHMYFHVDTMIDNRKFDDKRGRHIDIQGEGKYVVAPGSIHPDTKRQYDILNDATVMTIDPMILKEKLKSLGFDVERKSIEEIAKGSKEGGRNNDTFKYACYLIRQGVYGEALRMELEKLNTRHVPPLPERELNMILIQATRYEPQTISSQVTILEKIIEEAESAEDPTHCSMQEITPKLEGKTISFNATVIATGERMAYFKQATFMCEKCAKEVSKVCNEYYELEMPFCYRHKKEMEVLSKETDYIQDIRIQEFLESARDSTPVEFNARITGDLVGEAYISQRKRFTCILRCIPPKGKKFAEIVLQVEKMDNLDQDTSCMPTEEEINKWKSDPDLYDKVKKSIAPTLYMNPKIIETCMLAISGGTSLNGKRENIHVGLYGDAQLGKSELLEFLNQMCVGSAYVVGNQSSGPGLTIGMVKLFNQTMSPKAGVLPSHANKLVCIDEVDKMKKEDREYLLGSMEQGFTTASKAGFPNIRLPTNNIIIDAGNPKNGKFNPNYPSIMDNFVFDTPFVTRHDIIWLIIDENDPQHDDVIMNHIQNYKNNVDQYMTLEELQRFFAYVNKIESIVPKSIIPLIDEIYREIRPFNKLEGVPIGLRFYYGLYRMITASAACHLREEANEEDVKIVRDIVAAALLSLKIDVKNGTQIKPMEKTKETKANRFLETWNECMDEEGLVGKEEFITVLSGQIGFNETNARKYVEEQEKNGRFLIDTDSGRLKLIA